MEFAQINDRLGLVSGFGYDDKRSSNLVSSRRLPKKLLRTKPGSWVGLIGEGLRKFGLIRKLSDKIAGVTLHLKLRPTVI
jgi:hypothetical protein